MSEELFDNKSFCVLPFIHLATHPVGTVTPCCITDMTNNLSSAKKNDLNLFLNHDSLEDITNSENFKQIRNKMLKNEFPNECKTCHFHEKNKIYSKRMESNLKFKNSINEAIVNTLEDGSLKQINYKYLELRLGNVCNLKCITCNPFSSSKWHQDVNAFKNTEFEREYFSFDSPSKWYKDIAFYDELLSKSQNLEEIWINGGEPTLIKEHIYFLNKLVDLNKAKDINLMYSINMTNIPEDMINIWKKFKKVKIHMSIDDLFERNDYIRYGSSWEIIFKNFLNLIKYKKIFDLEICQTVSAFNVFNIDNFKNFFSQYDIIIAHNFVHNPQYLHPSVVPEEMKQDIVSNIKYLKSYEKERLISEIFKENNSSNKFYNFVNIIDKKRNLKISDSLIEWKNFF
jgi:hypothetical protein